MENSRKVWYALLTLLVIAGAGYMIYGTFSGSTPSTPAPVATTPTADTTTATTPTTSTDTSTTNPSDSMKKDETKQTAPADATPPAKVKPTSFTFQGALPADQIANKKVTLKTTKGDITFELFDKDAPVTVSNFVYLAENLFYDGLIFHRVVPNFVIQGGDPTGTGMGGPGYKFADEKVTRNYDQGIVAMANSGPNTNGSQFFIMLEDTPLPKAYTIFGKVTSGMDVVKKIGVGDVMNKVIVMSK